MIMQDVEFKVTGRSESSARIRVAARNFSLVVDEPHQLGGTDEGANPVEYLLAALLGCLNVAGHIVAKEMGFTIESLEIEASGPLNPSRLFNQPTEDRAGYKQVSVNLQVKSDANEDTLTRWLAAVESRCPVSDNIGNATPVSLLYSVV
jgi:uncharacterized OsmC-like protein